MIYIVKSKVDWNQLIEIYYFDFYIIGLNEELVKLLMDRDSLSMEQDSILVDIEDLTK